MACEQFALEKSQFSQEKWEKFAILSIPNQSQSEKSRGNLQQMWKTLMSFSKMSTFPQNGIIAKTWFAWTSRNFTKQKARKASLLASKVHTCAWLSV